jgi:hypothetical protein
MEKQTHPITSLKQELKECMKKEIGLMREVLANMHQEEVALIMFDKSGWTRTLQERFPLMQDLSSLRLKRDETVKIMMNHFQMHHEEKKIPMEKIFPSNHEDSCEILYLSDQILALVARMNAQNTKNEVLTKKYDLYAPHVQNAFNEWTRDPFPSRKIKTSLATIPQENSQKRSMP